MKKAWVWGVVLMAGMTASGCLFFGSKIKPPTLQVASMKFAGTGLTGAKLNIAFNIRNVNPTPLVVENFRYELKLNDTAVGSGFYSTRMELAGMAEQKVTSVFDLGYLKMPAAVQSLMQQDKVQARVNCKFYLAGGDTMNYTTIADVTIDK
jgi:LEA14-like dessication related protein